MRRIFISVVFVCSVLFFMTSCIKDGDDLDDCGQFIQFVYDYNMDFTDLFNKQATKINVFVYDTNGTYVTTLQDQMNRFPEGYRMQIPASLPDGQYQFVVWSGLYAESYNIQKVETNLKDINSMQVEVKNYTAGNVDFEMKPLFHGLQVISVNHQIRATYPVYLKKDTKKFRIVMQDLTDDSRINVNDYTFEICAANGLYDYQNNPSGNIISYTPYFTYNDADAGAVAELNTLRLISGSDNRLKITNKLTGLNIINIKLDKYLAALKLHIFDSMPYQEYLDREDSFAIILLFKDLNPADGNISLTIKINGWLVHEQDGEL